MSCKNMCVFPTRIIDSASLEVSIGGLAACGGFPFALGSIPRTTNPTPPIRASLIRIVDNHGHPLPLTSRA